MGVLPGGTGNGFAREVGTPGKLRDAVVLLCTSRNTRAIDVGRLVSVGEAKVDDRYFIQRVYIGVEPEEQTSREQKDKYGVFAYAVNMAQHRGDSKHFRYAVEVDGEAAEVEGTKVYLINSGMMGTGLRITHTYSIEDGLLDCFVVDKGNLDTLVSATERFLALPAAGASQALPPGTGGEPGRGSRPAHLGGRRVHRPHAAQGRRPAGRPAHRRPLTWRPTPAGAS